MASVPEIALAMKTLLTETAARLGRSTGFVQRQSKLGGANFARTVVLGWEQHPAATLDQLAQTAATLGISVSPQGIDERFSERTVIFLEALLQSAVNAVISGDPVTIPLLHRFGAVLVQDSTIINLPDELARFWRGCGDVVQHHLAALKLQVRLDLLTGQLQGPLPTAGRTHDRVGVLSAVAGALHLSDLGYFALSRLQDIAAAPAFFLSRLLVQTAVFDAATGQRLDLGTFLRHTEATTVDMPVLIGATERLPVRLLAARVPQEVADQRRRRLKDDARRRGETVSAARLAVVDWTIYVTNVPPDRLSLAEALVLARLRWQIELLFKLWKQVGLVDEWRTENPWRILTEVYAKLIAQLLQHWLIVASCWHDPDRSLTNAAATVRDHTILLAYALAGQLDLLHVLTLIQTALVHCPRLERRRKHPAAYQLALNPGEVT
jgi:Transposase DDE domain